MSQNLSADQELVSDVVACQLVIKQILDVLDVIAPVEVREKMSTQLKNIDFASHPAAAPLRRNGTRNPAQRPCASRPVAIDPRVSPRA